MSSIPISQAENTPTDNVRAVSDDWPEATPEGLAAVTEGGALFLPTQLTATDAPGHGRSQEAVNRLGRDPEFREAVNDLVGRFARAMPTPSMVVDADGDLATASEDHAWIWAGTLTAAANDFARRRRFPLLTHLDVCMLLFQAVTQALSSGYTGTVRFRGSTPLVYINPFDDRTVTLTLPPRTLVVDMTCSTSDDLDELKTVLTGVQRRLGYKKLTGRRALRDEGVMQFVHKMKTRRTGRGSLLSWSAVTERVNTRFGSDLDEHVLKQRYSVWKKDRQFTVVGES
jgi:hypothetical protein